MSYPGDKEAFNEAEAAFESSPELAAVLDGIPKRVASSRIHLVESFL